MSVLKRKDAGVWEVVGGGEAPPIQLGYAQVTANQTGIGTSDTDLTGLSVTVNVAAGRTIRITGHAAFQKITSTGISFFLIKEGATLLNEDLSTLAAVDYWGAHAEVILTPSAGSHTYKLAARVSAGTLNLEAAATFPAFILVEDITGGSGTLNGSSVLLASASLRHATVDTLVTTTSTSAVEIDSTNLSVTFTAPASGQVIVGLSGYGHSSTGGSAVIWSLRNNSPANVAATAQNLQNGTAGVLATYRCRVTGLTPGNSYTWRWAWRITPSGTASIYHGPTYGSLVMEVWSA